MSELIKSAVTGMGWHQWAALGLLAVLLFRNRDVLTPAIGWLKSAVLPPATTPDTADDAFHAAKVLIAHYEAKGCQEGLKAAREAGKHLFDAPGEHA